MMPREEYFTSVMFVPKIHNSHLIMRKPQLSPRNKWYSLFLVMKEKGRPGDLQIREDQGGVTTKCIVGSGTEK